MPVVVEAPIAPRSEEPQPPSVPWAAEIEIAGATVCIDAGAPAATISAVIDALRPGR